MTNKSEIFVEAFMCRVCVSLAAKRSEEINGSTLLKKERKWPLKFSEKKM